MKIGPQQRCNDRNQPMAEKKSRNLNYDADFGTIFRLVSVSKEAGTTLYLFLSVNYHTRIFLKKLLANVQKVLVQFKGTVSRDFLLQDFFMNHLPPSP